jgi:CO/xanthine dehydrogenase FAD-binding subunit
MGFRLHRPETVGAPVGLARECSPEARYLAGATDLIIQIYRGRCIEPLATVANAVAAAVGVRIIDAPITAEKILRRLAEHE